MSRKIVSLLVITSLFLVAIPVFAGTPPKDAPASAILVASPCPDGWQLKGKVTKSDKGGQIFVCVPKKPVLNCGPDTTAKFLPCEVGCQPSNQIR